MCRCRGAIWSVHQCKAKSSNKLYAVKIFHKQVQFINNHLCVAVFNNIIYNTVVINKTVE